VTLFLCGLGLLVAGMIASVILLPWSRAALGVALSTVGLAGLMFVCAGVQALFGSQGQQAALLTWALPLGSAHLAIDALSGWFLLPIGIVSVAVAIYSWGYFQEAEHSTHAMGPLMCLVVAGIALSVGAADVPLFLLGWELMSLSAFLLVGFQHRDSAARQGAWMYLVATHLGTAFGALPVFGVFVARTGSTSFASFGHAFTAPVGFLTAAVFCLALIGFGTKAGLMPMHVWLPAAHPVAPSPVSALMSGVVIKTGIYGLLRTLSWLPPLPVWCSILAIVVGTITGVMGIVYALPQRQYKRMLAYSSVENMGIIAIGVGLGMLGRTLNLPVVAAMGFGGAMLHVLNHSLFKGLLFLSAGAVLHGTGADSVERLGGLARQDRANATLFLIGSAAICGLPPFNGFVSEFLIYRGLLRVLQEHALLIAVAGAVATACLALIGGLAVIAFSKLFAVMFLGEPRDERIHLHRSAPSMVAGMSLLAGGCLLVALSAPLAGGMLRAPVSQLLSAGPEFAESLHQTLGPLASVSGVFLLLLAMVGGLTMFRRRHGEAAVASAAHGTWGCGFAASSPRVQYTGSSYVWNLVDSFRSVARVRRFTLLSKVCFPEPAELTTQVSDAAMQFGYGPLFRWVSRACGRLWPLQHGRIQLYLVYVVVTVVIAFVVEFGISPFTFRPILAGGTTQAAVHHSSAAELEGGGSR
jgi:hydrogenase-4 component B